MHSTEILNMRCKDTEIGMQHAVQVLMTCSGGNRIDRFRIGHNVRFLVACRARHGCGAGGRLLPPCVVQPISARRVPGRQIRRDMISVKVDQKNLFSGLTLYGKF